ncbi:MAG TPA: hypothetical protein VLJ10_02930 [Candidatus Bathyarchaeia archaeon]|nr:hypothetical protein [Candidatus Bathyarchaeia archaeon]
MSYQCPLCGQKFQDQFSAYVDHMKSEIVDQIKEDHPQWAEKDGSCQKCYEYYQRQLKGE